MEEARASRVSVLADRVPGQWGIRGGGEGIRPQE